MSAEQAIAHVRALSYGPVVDPSLRITVNFHPDWPIGRRTVVEALADEGVYRSQFVTRHEQRRPDRAPGRRSVALGEPHLRRRLRRSARRRDDRCTAP